MAPGPVSDLKASGVSSQVEATDGLCGNVQTSVIRMLMWFGLASMQVGLFKTGGISPDSGGTGSANTLMNAVFSLFPLCVQNLRLCLSLKGRNSWFFSVRPL